MTSITSSKPITAVTTSKGGGGVGVGVGGGITSLLEKYATLNHAITSTRSQITQTQNDITAIETQIATLQSQNETMQKEIKDQSRSIIPMMRKEHHAISKEHHSLVQTEMEMNQSMMIEKQRLDQLKGEREEVRMNFLNSCREFRINVRRNRVCLEGLLASSSSSSGSSAYHNNTSNDDDDDDANDGRSILRKRYAHKNDENSYLDITNQNQTPLGRFQDYEVRVEYTNQYDEDHPNFETSDNAPTQHNRSNHDDNEESDEDGLTLSTTESTFPTSMTFDINKTDAMSSTSSSSDLHTTVASTTTTIRTVETAATTNNPMHSKTIKKRRIKERSNDDEINHAVRTKIISTKMRSQAKYNLDKIKQERKIIGDRAKDRSKKLEQQRGQLEKVRLDVQEMERKIASIEENTIECRQIIDGYVKDAERRKQNLRKNQTPITSRQNGAVTPSPYSSSNTSTHSSNYQSKHKHSSNYNHDKYQQSQNSSSTVPHTSKQVQHVHNPYKKKELGGNSASTKVQHCNDDAYRSSLAKQHPHRAGRIRVDRRFTTALSIASTNEDEDEDENGCKLNDESISSTSSAKRKNKDMGQKRSSSVSIDDSMSARRSMSETSSDDDDEEDDDLLLFLPFDK